jgi:hypothetical protein
MSYLAVESYPDPNPTKIKTKGDKRDLCISQMAALFLVKWTENLAFIFWATGNTFEVNGFFPSLL